jgi:excisionase family DNA binding protein
MSVQERLHRPTDSHPGPTALLTVEQVAALLAVSKPTVRRMADRGHLARVRAGPGARLVRFRVADVQALMVPAKNEGPAASEGSAKTPSPPPYGPA